MTTISQSVFSAWVEAFRLRTLPLALSTIFVGSFLAVADGHYDIWIIGLAVLTTLFLQILSNLANDYGDVLKGTDNDDRVGPKRGVQSGKISLRQIKSAIILFVMLSFVAGLGLLYVSLGNHFLTALLFLALGLAAIAASIKYTAGSHAYGYRGLGDVFVFVFFGLVAVLGTYYLNSQQFHWRLLLPAAAMGLLSAGVLNLNNMRDMDNDRASGKHTIASRLGYDRARIYHALLVIFALVFATVYVLLDFHSVWNFLFLLSFPLFFRDLIRIFKISDKAVLDGYLKSLALSTLLFSVLFGIGICL
ncbi:MAG: 1,4-dihydroxy-2-naphthoate octaprenyltransferase [bacterium]|nr:MAG: 1,4-dihydroxy-2-naphthoate octaprenyltransferase [bacterium]